MAGTWICSKNYAFDRGAPLPGAIAQFYSAQTLTPMTVFVDYDLTTPAGSFVVANGNGQWPVVYLDEAAGFYRYRSLRPDGSILDDMTTLAIIGPGMGPEGGGGSVDATQLISTGFFNWRPQTGELLGWVRANSRTIGAAGSSGTERHAADCSALFAYLWLNFSNTECPVTPGGRGANASSDWLANKVIATPDLRGRGVIGADKMGAASFAGRITSASVGLPDDIGAAGGSEKVTLTIAQLPVHHHPVNPPSTTSGNQSPANHTHSIDPPATNTGVGTAHSHGPGTLAWQSSSASGGSPNYIPQGNLPSALGSATFGVSGATATEALHTHAINIAGFNSGNQSPANHTHSIDIASFNSGDTGTGAVVSTISPFMIGTWYIKL